MSKTSNSKSEFELFRTGYEPLLEKVYLDVKPIFIGYFKKEYQLTSNVIEDLYQDSYCVLHKKILSGSMLDLTSKWETLLIGIGRNLIRNQLRKKSEYSFDGTEDTLKDQTLDGIQEKEEQEHVQRILDLLGEICRRVLIYYYYEEKSMLDIAKAMKYANENVAKKKKSLCLKTLREKIRKNGLER